MTYQINKAKLALSRLIPRIRNEFPEIDTTSTEWKSFLTRLETNFPRLFELLLHLYGSNYDFFYHLEQLLFVIVRSWLEREPELKTLDEHRAANPAWFKSNQMLGGVCYVDLFAKNLKGIERKIPYFKELGLNYLHLMPLYKCPETNNDGGYAVSSYREVNPALGKISDLKKLTLKLRKENISLVLDFVFNHTSDEHEWAMKAKQGDQTYQSFYWTFPDRHEPNAYEQHLREIFPEERPGSFSFNPEINRWVWTTFHSYQWDLNYANPMVFNKMAEELLFIASIGVEVLRLDAVAFIWKEMGTSCENLPETHMLIQAFNAVTRIAAPSLLFKSEAIVHPDEVSKYISPEECQLSYNPLLMALLWNSLATREVKLLKRALQSRHTIPDSCAWVNYVRCHDDIGWTFSDQEAAQLGINGYDHRQFLNAFYTGRFKGSFARGLPFQENPRTGDARISGTCASLAGLEQAINEKSEKDISLSISRILLIHSILLFVGGIPLIYLGDEIGTLNDYSFRDDAAKSNDSRWMHRPTFDWEKANSRSQASSIERMIFYGLQKMIAIRNSHEAFSVGDLNIIS
ncbi:MAG: alpha-amylase family protein, partial [Anaerolineaceae bacterium]|nr:alpha-amylase family protein [Anaerolineaceae bacterium]